MSAEENPMFDIAGNQILLGMRDAKFLFMALLVLVAFVANGFIYSSSYHIAREDYEQSQRKTQQDMEAASGSLLDVTNYMQTAVRPPSPLSFIADGGSAQLPNSWQVNAFMYQNPENKARSNEQLPIRIPLDWSFIVGTLMSLLTILISYEAISGEKRDGTLRLLLSNPVSRIQLFLGKYLGLLSVLLITLVVGVVINLTILITQGVLPVTADVTLSIGWALLLASLCLSFFLLLSVAISSLVETPVTGLVVLIIAWILSVAAFPGAARMVAEQSVKVPASFDVTKEIKTKDDDLEKSMPPSSMNWDGNPFAEWMPNRAEYCRRRIAIIQSAWAKMIDEQTRQARLINYISFVSPTGLLNTALQDTCETGISGFDKNLDLIKRYQGQLHDFTMATDRLDKDSPHFVYTWGDGTDPGVYSTKPVDLSAVPRTQALWSSSGLSSSQTIPWLQLILLAAANLQMAVMAFFALLRYDPR
jgi:ABC-type transport system involved in multi-copper enzyme maturation permease subunit